MTMPAGEGTFLKQRLAALRRRIRLVATFRGTAWLLAAVLFTLLFVGLLDWRFHRVQAGGQGLPGLVRAFALVGLLGGAGLLIRRLLWRPLSEPADDLSLALRVEERYPALEDALASTVQFLNRSDAPEGESASMRREAVRRTLGKLGGLDFKRVVDSRGLVPAALCAPLGRRRGTGGPFFCRSPKRSLPGAPPCPGGGRGYDMDGSRAAAPSPVLHR